MILRASVRSRERHFDSNVRSRDVPLPATISRVSVRSRGTSRSRQDNSIQFPQARRPGGRQQPEQNSPDGTRPAQNQPQRRKHRRMTRQRCAAAGLDATDGLWLLLCVIERGLSDATMPFCKDQYHPAAAGTHPPRWNRRRIFAARRLRHWGWPAARISSVLTQMPGTGPGAAVPLLEQ